MPYSSSTVIAHLEPPSSRKRSKTGKKGLFWPQNTLLGTPEVLRGPRGARFGPNCHRLVKLMITTQFGLVSGPFWPKMPLLGASEVSQVTRFGCFIVLHVIELYSIVLYAIHNGIAISLYCMVQHSITRGCTVYIARRRTTA